MRLDLFGDKSREMPPVERPHLVRSVQIWHCNYKTLEPIKALSQIHTLVIATYPDPTLSILASLNLRYLRILHLPKVEDLSPLVSLKKLEVLSLETLPSWDCSGKVTLVNSLDPISRLSNLKHLSLFGVVPIDKSLQAIERCPALESARFSKYPKREISRFFFATGISNAHIPRPTFEEPSE